MRIESVTIKNYRSIVAAKRVRFGELTVFVGANNEGKSNILRALALGLQAVTSRSGYRGSRSKRMALTAPRYDWERDFPISARSRSAKGQTSVRVDFAFAEEDVDAFQAAFDVHLRTGKLPIKTEFGKQSWSLTVPLKGPANRTLNERASAVVDFIRERVFFQYVPAIRTSEMANFVVSEMLGQRLASLEDDPDYQQLLAQVDAKQQRLRDHLANELFETLHPVLPSLVRVDVSSGEESLARAVRSAPRILIDDGDMTEIAEKGDGIKSLVTLSLLRHASEADLGGKSLILAIEEPETHLHPDAIHHVRGHLHDLAQMQQVILTTHSPVLVARQAGTRNIVVRAGGASVARSIREIRDALGVRVADNLTTAEVALLVEGDEDRVVLTRLLRAAPRLRAAFDNGRLTIVSMGGASKLPYFAQLYRSFSCGIYAVVDDDDAGRTAIAQAVARGAILHAEYTILRGSGRTESEFEDLLDPDAYVAVILADYGVDLPINPRFRDANSKWSDRVANVFRLSGKQWNADVEKAVKVLVAKHAADAGWSAVRERDVALLEKVRDDLSRTLQ